MTEFFTTELPRTGDPTELDLLASAGTIEEGMQAVAAALCEVLGAVGAGVGMLAPDGAEVYLKAFILDNKLSDVKVYPLLHTPCSRVYYSAISGENCYYSAGVCQHYPQDAMLQEMAAESYWGRPLLDRLDCPIGHVFAIGREPLTLNGNQGLLDAITSRAQNALRQWLDQEKKQQQLQFWQHAMENMPYGVACFALRGRPLWMNLAAARLWGYASISDGMQMLLEQHLLPADLQRIIGYEMARIGGKEAPQQYRLKILTLQGQERCLQLTVDKVDWLGSPAFLCLIDDVSTLELTEKRLEYYRQTVSASQDLIYFMDRKHIIRAANPKLAEALGLDSVSEVIDRPVAEVFSLAMRNTRLDDSYRKALAGETVGWEDWRQLPGLGRRYMEVIMAPYINASKEVEGIAVVSHDITARLRNQQLLAERERYLSSLLASLPGMAYRSRDAHRQQMHFVSSGCLAICGYSPEVLEGEQDQCWATLIAEEDRLTVAEQLEEAMRTGEAFTFNYRIIHRDGNERRVCESGAMVRNEAGELTGVEGFIRDITESHKMSQTLSYQATHDHLTQIINRQEFSRILGELLADAESRARGVSACYLDLDEFKVVNDTAGHTAGDRLLVELCKLLQGQLRAGDVLGRLGGDEFGVIVRDCSAEGAMQVAEKLRLAVTRFRFVWADNLFSVGVSIGLVPITDDIQSVEDVLRISDGACLLAKEKGRNQVYLANTESQEMVLRQREMNWSLQINQALDNDDFLLYAQPIVDARKPPGQQHHFEILLRMQMDDQVVAPGLFLPAAERYHLAQRIDMWVIKHVLEFFVENPECLERLGKCMINLSGLSLSGPRLGEQILGWLDECQLPAEKIGFEITETAAISELDQAVHFIETVQARGCQVALDDFGSGLSSFAYLRYLPVDIVKIDGAIVRECHQDSMSQGIVKSVCDIAHLGGMKTVAEFVENDAIIQTLNGIGIDYLQGYAICVPQPLAVLLHQQPAGVKASRTGS